MIKCLPAIVNCYVLNLLFISTNHVHMYSRKKLYCLNQIRSLIYFISAIFRYTINLFYYADPVPTTPIVFPLRASPFLNASPHKFLCLNASFFPMNDEVTRGSSSLRQRNAKYFSGTFLYSYKFHA